MYMYACMHTACLVRVHAMQATCCCVALTVPSPLRPRPSPAGMVKPPKQKTNDEDRLFVQRPVVNQEEEFRQKPKKAGPKKD